MDETKIEPHDGELESHADKTESENSVHAALGRLTNQRLHSTASLNVGFEYVLVYAKSPAFLMKAIRMKKENASSKGRWDVFWSNADRPTMRYNILGFTPETGQWRNSEERAKVAVANYQKYQQEYEGKISLEEYAEKTGITDFIRRIPISSVKYSEISVLASYKNSDTPRQSSTSAPHFLR